MDEKLFNTASANLLTTVSCIDNSWIVVSRNLRNVNIAYYARDNVPLTCDINPDENTDILVDCGSNGKYNTFDGVCYDTLTNIMFMLTQ